MERLIPLKKYAYVIALICVYTGWTAYMTQNHAWHLFQEWWQMSVTMLFGSFVAGATPTGGAAVAFPVFTKLLQVPAAESRVFGMMIQSFGMTAASIYIWSRGTAVLWRVIGYTALGSFAGIAFASYTLHLPDNYARILFTVMISTFALALLYNEKTGERLSWQPLRKLNVSQKAEFITLGFIGGIFAENTGSGVDIVLFMMLSLCYRIEEKVSVPSSVIVMAISSIFGFIVHGSVLHDTAPVFAYWLVCIPVVIVGAPLGAWVVYRCKRWQIVTFLCTLILADLISTLLFLKFAEGMLENILAFITLCLACFSYLLWRGNRLEKKSDSFNSAFPDRILE